jgi:hypothetical protein
MLTETRERALDLLQKNAPLLFIQRDTGLKPSEIVQLSNQTKNDRKSKRHRYAKGALKLSFRGKNRAFKVADLPELAARQQADARKQPKKTKTRKSYAKMAR